MSVGHIKLDGRDYLLKGVTSYRRYPVNQMAPKIGSGAEEYGDLTSWSAWIAANWQEGVGQRAEDEGFLYGEVDSRVPNQLILPPKVEFSDGLTPGLDVFDARYNPDDMSRTLRVGGDSDVKAVSIYMEVPDPPDSFESLWFYMSTSVGVTVEVWQVDEEENLPSVLKETGTISPVSYDPMFRWYHAAISYSLTEAVCLVLRPTNASESFTLAGGGAYDFATTGVYDGSTWAVSTAIYPAFLTDTSRLPASVTDIVRFGNSTYAAVGDQLYKYDAGNGDWQAVGNARANDITDLTVWGDKLYIGLGNITAFDTMTTGESFSSDSEPGRLFYAGGGFLWRAVGNKLYYSADGSTWSGPIECGSAQYQIRGITELDGDVYVATDAGLIQIAPGDFARGAIPFGSTAGGNGVDLLTHQGAMYMPAQGQYLQVSSGAVRNIWTSRKDEFPGWAQGRITHAERMVNWPVALLSANSAAGFDSVWLWQDIGWHFLLQLPQGLKGSCLRYDPALGRLWVGTDQGIVLSVSVPNHIINPFQLDGYLYAPYGWLETDWFSGGVLEAQKDIESVYLRCRRMSVGRTVSVYWQDDASWGEVTVIDEDGNDIGEGTDIVGAEFVQWSFLGTFDEDRQELFWDIDELRPNTKEIRLGFLVHSGIGATTPKVEAWRLKYHMMVRDWYGWDLPLAISGTPDTPQQMLDGEPNPFDALAQIDHLDSLVQQVPPLRLVDLDGKEYIVKINSASFSPEQVEYWGGRLHYFGTYTVQLEQVRHG